MHGSMMGWEYGFAGGWLGMFIPLILIGAIIYIVVKLSVNSDIRNGKEYNSSIEILGERFARGEISEEEYEHKKAILLRRL